MQELYVQKDMFTGVSLEPAKETTPEHRRLTTLPDESFYDFTCVDFGDQAIHASLTRAYRVILQYRHRRIAQT